MQCRQCAGIEECIGQPRQPEAGGLRAVAQQRARHRLAEAADHRMVLGHDHQSVLATDGLDDRRLVQWLDRGAMHHGHIDSILGQVRRHLERAHGQDAARDEEHVVAVAQHLGLAEFEAVVFDLVEHQRHLPAQQAHVDRSLVGRDLRHRLLDVQCVARVDDREAGHTTHHREVVGGLMAGTIARGQAGQGAADLDVEVLLGDHLMDEVVSAARTEHRIRGGERHQTLLGHATRSTHQQLLGHAHLVEALRVGLSEQVQVGVLGQVGGQAHDLGVVMRILHQRLAERCRRHLLPVAGDRRDHRRGREARLLVGNRAVHAGTPSGCDRSRI